MKSAFVLITIIWTSIAAAQTHKLTSIFNNGKITGIVVDAEEGSPLPSANVTLNSQSDSAFITGVSSGDNGEFILNHLIEGKYYLKISYVGYSNKYIPNITVSNAQSEFNAGTIKLGRNTFQLAEAKVVGEKAAEELHLDKKVINVGQNINASGGTALDVLQDQPSIRVDPDGTVYLRGSSDFKVLINGKPSVLQGADALKQISANMIDNIEIITNPSAKYDAEGTAGIINIILKKQKEYALSGIANISSGTRDKYNADASINYNQGNWNITGGMDYRDNANFNDQGVDRSFMSSAGSSYNSTKLFIRDKRRQYSGRAGIDYSINNQNSVSLSLSGGSVDVKTSINTDVENVLPGGFAYAYNENLYETPVKYFNSSFNYDHKFTPGVNSLDFEATYTNVSLPGNRNTYEYVSDNTFTLRTAEPSKTNFINDAERNEGRLKLNYSHKITDQSTFETGFQSNFSYRNFDIKNMLYDWTSHDYVIDRNLTNKFNFKNNIYAAFASYSNAVFGLDYMIGLRAEYTDRLLDQKTTGGMYKFEKTDFFPSLNISGKIGENQLQFGYSRRITRPHEDLLNPFPFYDDSDLTTAGNPNLIPEYINSFEFNYQKMFGSVFFAVQTYYRHSDNKIEQAFSVRSDGKLLGTFINFAKTNTYGAEISSSLKAFGFLKLDPGVSLYELNYSGSVIDMNVNKNSFNWNSRLNTTFTLSPDMFLQVGGNYFGKISRPQLEIRPFFMLNASLKKEFFNKKLSLTLQARNILNTANLDIINNGSNFNSTIFIHREVPVISLMVGYNFNNFKKTNRHKDDIDIRSGI